VTIRAGANGSRPRERQLVPPAGRALGRLIEEDRNGFEPLAMLRAKCRMRLPSAGAASYYFDQHQRRRTKCTHRFASC
jgi:hypothetical protein